MRIYVKFSIIPLSMGRITVHCECQKLRHVLLPQCRSLKPVYHLYTPTIINPHPSFASREVLCVRYYYFIQKNVPRKTQEMAFPRS